MELPLLNILGNDVIMQLGWDYRVKCLSVCDESSHNISIDSVGSNFTLRSSEVLVHGGNVERQLLI